MGKEDAAVNRMTKFEKIPWPGLSLLFRKGVCHGCLSGIKLKEYVL
jgi:hypothetical protein